METSSSCLKIPEANLQPIPPSAMLMSTTLEASAVSAQPAIPSRACLKVPNVINVKVLTEILSGVLLDVTINATSLNLEKIARPVNDIREASESSLLQTLSGTTLSQKSARTSVHLGT